MPNFFKKLTGSLNIKSTDEDILEEKDNEDIEGTRPEDDAIQTEIKEENEKETAEDEILTKTVSWQEIGGKKPRGDITSTTVNADADELLEEKQNEEEEQVEKKTLTQDQDSSSMNALEESLVEETSTDEEPPVVATLASAKVTSPKKSKKGISRLRLKTTSRNNDESSLLGSSEGQLAIDVYETSKEVIIKSTIAGVKPEDLDVGIEDNTINIRGSRHNEEKVRGEDYFYQECYWGTFSRSIILPVEVDTDKTNASLKDGILTIRLPKIIKEKEKKIKILG